MKQALPPNFKAKGNLFVFVDECHRTQSGDLHEAMKEILPGAVFIGFTGTPLLKADKQKSIEIFGRYIHTYKFDEAVKDGVVLDLRYEARDIDQKMLADWFNEAPERAVNRVEEFEKAVKKTFIEEPGQMKLLIVVDKLLTGFDAPPATYLYIDKQMHDHGLFQAICRVNRLDGDDKDYGYIVDYKDLFKSLERSIHDYTSEALDAYDKEDVKGLLEERLQKGREDLEEAREAVKG